MRPLRLILDGFGSYRTETDIDFTGVDFFALTGPTGSGKSTVIDALCFALYGTVPRWDNEKEVRNALAPSANACKVSLIFELSGKRYVAARALQRDGRGRVTTRAARLERLDAGIAADAPLTEILQASVEQIAEGPDRVKAAASELLGLSYRHFIQSVLLPQGSFAEFLRADPAKRQQLLVELLAFGVYKEAGQRARSRAEQAENNRALARQARDRLGDATAEAEAEAGKRLADLTALADRVDADLAALTGLQDRAAEAAQQVRAEQTVAGALSAVITPADVAGLAAQIGAADTLFAGARQRRDDSAALAREAEQARAALGDKAEIQRQLGMHELRRQLTGEAAGQAGLLSQRSGEETRLAAELQAADQEAAAAGQALDAAQRAHAAAGLAEHLHPGDDCPVCGQRVGRLAAREAPADLAAARTARDQAAAAHRRAQAAHHDAVTATATVRAALENTRGRLEKAAALMTGVPGEAELGARLQAITAADEQLASARAAAGATGTELAVAEQARASLAASEQRAWAALRAARDKLVAHGAPPVEIQDLAAAWTQLTDWAAAEASRRRAALPGLQATAADTRAQAAAAADALTALLAGHDVTADPLSRAPAEVAGQKARAAARLDQARRDRREAARLDKQIAACKEEADVAGMLGNLLRANRFENWLCSEALSALVAEASATLMELTGSQYELTLSERGDLEVIDYTDAGSRRPVHTLSGGETFQASLALALALSRQVIGLSGGLRELDSMFLDEGFGTLDPDTLDTVASTLERLAADSDRMVGVITHVTELAERVPVRFEVTRTGTTSSIVRTPA